MDGKPDYIPDDFWDPDAGEPKVEDLARAYGEVSQQAGRTREELAAEVKATLEQERLARRPEKPEDYEIGLPEGFEVPEGVELNLEELKADPMLEWWRGKAHELGLPQDEFKGILGKVAEFEAAQLARHREEMGKLGENGPTRLEHIKGWLGANMPPDVAEIIGNGLTTAKAVESVEAMIKKQSATAPASTEPPGKPKTEAELRAMVDDPRYWRDRDRAYIQKVQAEFARAYPGTQSPR